MQVGGVDVPFDLKEWAAIFNLKLQNNKHSSKEQMVLGAVMQNNKMIFVIPALAASFLAVALMASKKRSAGVAKTLHNEKGKMDSWT